jgi:hypothetical protein
MANTDRANGLTPVPDYWGAPEPIAHEWIVTSGQTIAKGDIVYTASTGYVTIATATTASCILGVAATPVTASTTGQTILVYDNPKQVFEAQVSTGAATDPYTTNSAAACWDIVATTGAMYVNTAASSYNIIKTVGFAYDPATGKLSAAGSYQRQYVMFNPAIHVFGTTA